MSAAIIALHLSLNRGSYAGNGESILFDWIDSLKKPERQDGDPYRYDKCEAEKEATKNRYYGSISTLQGTSILVGYLDGRCKMTAYGTADVENLWGDKGVARNLREAPQYKEFAQKRLEMITPPTFMEKLMVLRHTMKNTEAGKVINTSTMGISAVAAGMVSLAARSYGKAKGYVVDKFLAADMNKETDRKKSFTNRLTELKERNEFKADIKKLTKIEKVRGALDDREKMVENAERTLNNRHSFQSDNKLLGRYLRGDVHVEEISKEGGSESYHMGWRTHESTSLDEVKSALDKTKTQVDLVKPATAIENRLLDADRWLQKRYEEKSVDSSFTAAAAVIIGKVTQKYIEKQAQKDPNFNGKQSLHNRFEEISMRRKYEADASKLHALHKKMSGR